MVKLSLSRTNQNAALRPSPFTKRIINNAPTTALPSSQSPSNFIHLQQQQLHLQQHQQQQQQLQQQQLQQQQQPQSVSHYSQTNTTVATTTAAPAPSSSLQCNSMANSQLNTSLVHLAPSTNNNNQLVHANALSAESLYSLEQRIPAPISDNELWSQQIQSLYPLSRTP